MTLKYTFRKESLIVEAENHVYAGYVGSAQEIEKLRTYLASLKFAQERPKTLADVTKIVQNGGYQLSIGCGVTDEYMEEDGE